MPDFPSGIKYFNSPLIASLYFMTIWNRNLKLCEYFQAAALWIKCHEWHRVYLHSQSVYPIHFSEQAYVNLHENIFISGVGFTPLNTLNRFFLFSFSLEKTKQCHSCSREDRHSLKERDH